MSMGRATCPLLWAAALGAAQPCGVSLSTRGIAPASLRYDRLTLVVSVAGPFCLAGDPLLDCVPARLSPVASMAPVDVCQGPRCSLAGLGPVALEYRSCHWPGGSARSPQCVRPMGYWFFPAPRPPYVCAVSWAAWLLFTGVRAVCCVASAVSWATWLLFTGVLPRCVVLRVQCPGPLGSRSPVCALCAVRVRHGWLCPSSPPPNFFLFFFLKKKKKGARTLQAQARAAGAAVQQCCVLWRVSSVLWRRSRPRGAARAS